MLKTGDNPSVSVIMLTYNREQYVGRAIESILAQDYSDFEFIAVDNGSTDSSGKICDDYAKSDNRMTVIHIDKSNISTGRNAGISASKGCYIMFVDDDDIAEPDMISFLYRLIDEHKADISICGSWRSTDGVLTPKYIFDEVLILNAEQAVIELLKRERYNVAFPTKMLRREMLSPPPFPEYGRYDDITTAYKVFANANKVVVCGSPKYTFTRHSKNNSGFTSDHTLLNPGILDEYLSAFSERTKYLSERLPGVKEYAQYSEWSFMLSMYRKITESNMRGYDIQLGHIKEILKYSSGIICECPYIHKLEKAWLNKLMEER